MDEKAICANIQEFTEQLNENLLRAHELGLKIQISSFGRSVSVKVWRETELVNIPLSKLGPDWRQWPVEAQAQLLQYLRSLDKEKLDKIGGEPEK